MTYNDGIEAAKAAVRQSLESAATSVEQTHGEDVAAGLEEVSVRLLSKLDALKRSEPSEEEKVERVKSAIAHALCVDLKDPEGIARAAIKAMEG